MKRFLTFSFFLSTFFLSSCTLLDETKEAANNVKNEVVETKNEVTDAANQVKEAADSVNQAADDVSEAMGALDAIGEEEK